MTQREAFEKIEKIHTLLVGNGEIGLCEQTRNNTNEIENIKKNPDVIGKWIIRILLTLFGLCQMIIAYGMYKLLKGV
jgi:hypothetical protein